MSAEFASLEQSDTPAQPDLPTVIAAMVAHIADGIDHPELWTAIPQFLDQFPGLHTAIKQTQTSDMHHRRALALLDSLCTAASGDTAAALTALAPLALEWSQSALVQGVVFHVQSLADPDHPRFQLAGKICNAPFEQLDVLERSTHQCCASWLHVSAGDLTTTPWPQVWNSPTAQAVRASVLDGSYRYCNKTACPKIQADELVNAEAMAAQSPFWSDVIGNARLTLDQGPKVVNLAYDRTCNLACPSCRTERYAADEATRSQFDRLQEQAILPMLKHADVVFVTGSGDPFVSKNFRQLMTALTYADYPQLRFKIMTNGMLFNPRQWAEFPMLAGRVSMLKISIDAATGPTHETLRLGAHWPTVLENLHFAGQLTAQGQIDQFDLIFVVQQANYLEMGDAVDLAKAVGATGIYFSRLTNWGTYSAAGYAARAVCLPNHPDHAEFLDAMRDPRLDDPMVLLGDLVEFAPEGYRQARVFVH